MTGTTNVDPVTQVYALTNPITGQTFYAAPNYATVNGVVSPSAFVPQAGHVINIPQVAAVNGSRVPTAAEVQAIYFSAQNQIAFSPQPPTGQMSTYQWTQNMSAAINPSVNYDGSLVAGEMKDVVGSVDGQVAIFGGYYGGGTRVQDLSTIHDEGYADYSHGFRQIWDEPPEGVEVVDLTGREYTAAELQAIQEAHNQYLARDGLTSEVPDATGGEVEEGYGDGQVDPRLAEAAREQAAQNRQPGAPTGYDCYPSGGSGGRYDGGNVPVGPQIGGGSGAGATAEELRTIPPEVRRFLTTEELMFALNPTREGLGQFGGLFSFVNNSINGRVRSGSGEDAVYWMNEDQGLTNVAPAAMAHLILLAKRWTNQGGSPLEISSAYRSPEYNAFLRTQSSGVASRSLHMTGQAFDILETSLDFVRFARSQGFRGIGRYLSSGFTHIDLGPLRAWGDGSGAVSSIPVGTPAAAAAASGVEPVRGSDFVAPPPDTNSPS
jgi:hypothetical protein